MGVGHLYIIGSEMANVVGIGPDLCQMYPSVTQCNPLFYSSITDPRGREG